MVRTAAELADEWNLSGWRQARHHTVTLRRLYQRVASTRRSEAWRENVDVFLAKCEELLAKAEATQGHPARARLPAGGDRGTRPVHLAYEAPDRPDGPEDPAGGGVPPGRKGPFGIRGTYAVDRKRLFSLLLPLSAEGLHLPEGRFSSGGLDAGDWRRFGGLSGLAAG